MTGMTIGRAPAPGDTNNEASQKNLVELLVGGIWRDPDTVASRQVT